MIPEVTITQALLIAFFTICVLPEKTRNNVVKNIKSLLEVLPISKIVEGFKVGTMKSNTPEDEP